MRVILNCFNAQSLYIAALMLLTASAFAGSLRLEGNLVQGGLVFGTFPIGTELSLEGRSVRVSNKGNFVLGFGRDAPPEMELKAHYPSGVKKSYKLIIKQRKYRVQEISGLPASMVTPNEKALRRIRRENAWISEVRRRDTESGNYRSGFVWPLIGVVTGTYGSQRILNGQSRRPHFGIDIAASRGVSVHSPANGVIALAKSDLYFTGGTVMIDHGHGITSVLSHLETIGVVYGDKVTQGDVVGTVGSSGRATGPHLDWRVNWFEIRLDPALLVPKMPLK